jgi:hypothetical protein
VVIRGDNAMPTSGPPSSVPPELARSIDPWLARMEPRLRPVLERHHSNLVTLCRSLEQAGHGPDVIRSCIRDLVASYEAELAQSLTGRAAP